MLPLAEGTGPGSLPPYQAGARYRSLVETALEQYQSVNIPAVVPGESYDPTGDYLHYGDNDRYEADPSLRWNDKGAPLVQHGGAYYRNPVTVAQYALTLYGRSLRGAAASGDFLAIVDELLTMQDARSAFPYPFPFPYTYYRTGEVLEPGWVSGMAQGQVLSVLRRACAITADARYLDAGDAALNFLATEHSDGGPMDTLARLDPALSNFITLEEFVTKEPHYTLNGFIFTLLGVYDWSTIDRGPDDTVSARAAHLFGCGLATTVYTLPYYDVGGFSAYDLGHVLIPGDAPNLQAEYHAIHIELLRTLETIQPDPDIHSWLSEWETDVALR